MDIGVPLPTWLVMDIAVVEIVGEIQMSAQDGMPFDPRLSKGKRGRYNWVGVRV